MVKVITYGTYDLLHYGHIRLLERAKMLGDYLIVGVTADDFDKTRGKINVQQSLVERIRAVRETGLADEIIVEEYEGQKIDDIQRLGVDIFTVGSDWTGKFDYLEKYCKVVYLERTEGVSSSDIRTEEQTIRVGLLGNGSVLEKYLKESKYVNGIEVVGLCNRSQKKSFNTLKEISYVTSDFEKLLEHVDAVFMLSHPEHHYADIKRALELGKHVLCETPITINQSQAEELFELAEKQGCVLFDSIKTAYATAYKRALLLAKGGKIGEVVSVQTTCTSIKSAQVNLKPSFLGERNSMCAWGPFALLPIFQLLGTKYENVTIVSQLLRDNPSFDGFSKIDFVYKNAVATALIGKNVKSEGEMIVSGTKGYLYIPAPWWKTDYFEVRYEEAENNRRYFYQLEGEGIRYELVCFARAIKEQKNYSAVEKEISLATSRIIEKFYAKEDIFLI